MNTPASFIPLLAVGIIAVMRFREIYAKRHTVAGPIRENLTFRLFMLSGALMMLGSVGEYLWRGAHFSLWALAAGILCSAFSFSLRWKAIEALGRFWSLHVEIRDNHEFVESGPFGMVRHPTYFSMILELLAFGLICQAWGMLLIIPFVFIPALVLRLRLEERALLEKFGPTYADYQSRVPMLIPYKWGATSR